MHSRLQQHAPDLPLFFDMHECTDTSHEAYDVYEGVGAAIILTCEDDIIHLVYVEDDYQAAEATYRWYFSYDGAEYQVWFGMCSCTQLCDPLLIERGLSKDEIVRVMIAHGEKHRFMGYVE